jgi:hypothetical protein
VVDERTTSTLENKRIKQAAFFSCFFTISIDADEKLEYKCLCFIMGKSPKVNAAISRRMVTAYTFLSSDLPALTKPT